MSVPAGGDVLNLNLESFLARLHEAARTTSDAERQRVLRAVVKEIVDDAVIHHPCVHGIHQGPVRF